MANDARPARILIAEDFGPWRATLRDLIRHPGWKLVGEARDGPGAVLKASELQPDIVILDIGLQGINGIEAAKVIRQKCPTAKIIFLTQQTDSVVKEAAMEAGAVAYIVKSHAFSDLLPAIGSALQAASAPIYPASSRPTSFNC